MKTKLFAALSAITLGLTAPAFAGSLTATGPQGGTYAGSRGCAAAEGTRTCQGSGAYTGPAGRTSTRSGTTVLSQGGFTHEGDVMRPSGRSFSTTVTRKR